MELFFDIFSTRETSLLIWSGTAFIAAMVSKEFRNNLGEVAKLLFGSIIGLVLFVFTIYILTIIYILYEIGFWDISLLSGTISWFFTSALVLFFTINNANASNYFYNTTKEILKWSMVLEFVINFYAFNLVTELILFPIATFLGITQAYASAFEKYKDASKILKDLMAILGFILLALVIYNLYSNYQNLLNYKVLIAFLLPPLLTVLSFPFLYILAMYINYEHLFIRLEYMTNDFQIKKTLKRQILLTANINIKRLEAINKNLNKIKLHKSTNVKYNIKELI